MEPVQLHEPMNKVVDYIVTGQWQRKIIEDEI